MWGGELEKGGGRGGEEAERRRRGGGEWRGRREEGDESGFEHILGPQGEWGRARPK